MTYSPTEKHGLNSVADVVKWVVEELRKVAQEFNGAKTFQFFPSGVIPVKPREGMFAYTTGDDWNPGKGKGPYYFDGTNFQPMRWETGVELANNIDINTLITRIPNRPDLPVKNYISGMKLSRSSTTVIGIGSGEANEDTNTLRLPYNSSSTKTLAGPWAVGTSGQNGLDTGSVANNTWYHVFAIAGATLDFLFSTSLSPSMPVGYPLKRRIGSIRTNGSAQIIDFTQEGDDFLWKIPVLDVNGSTAATTNTLFALSVPPDVKVFAHIVGGVVHASAVSVALFYSPDETVQAINSPIVPNYNVVSYVAGTIGQQEMFIRTNTSKQIQGVSQVGTAMYISTKGWRDSRGRDG